MKNRRPDQGAKPLPPPAAQGAAPASPSSPAAQALLARTLKAIGERHGDDVIKDAGERVARAAKDSGSR